MYSLTQSPTLLQPHLPNRAPFLIQSTQIQLTIMQGELENRCSQSDLQEPLCSFPLPGFPLLSIQIHLQWEFEDVTDD